MQQLQFKDLMKLFEELKKKYPVERIMELPIYIGDDEELNGIHKAFRSETYTDEEFYAVNEEKEFKGTIILIS